MKYRIEQIDDLYYPQYRRFFMWQSFRVVKRSIPSSVRVGIIASYNSYEKAEKELRGFMVKPKRIIYKINK